MQTLALDFATDDARTGFRLQRLEVLNWGTFDRHVWRIEPRGHNALLTGDIGSGKSTLVDAVTTLLVPHHRIVYNKAAGAEGKERSLYSYIRGEYKSEKDELTQSAKAVALRDSASYTVLLAHFHNAGFDQGVTLAQVFWLKEGSRNPERFFVVAEQPLGVAEHFSGFGSDMLDLKRRLRRSGHVAVLDSFKDYGTRFRQLFGIQQEQALELFYQTVSMKSVGNLTEFVRGHMLEQSDVETRIEELRRNFDNLNRAHEAVLKARRQIEQLTPLVADGERARRLGEAIETLRGCREALVPYYAHHKAGLLEERIARLDQDIERLGRHLETERRRIVELRAREAELRTAIDESGGRRLSVIEQEVRRLQTERERRLRRAEQYRGHAQALDLPTGIDAEVFHANLAAATTLMNAVAEELDRIKQAEIDHAVTLREHRLEHQSLEAELQSLRRRKSNVPLKNLELRQEMAQVLSIAEEELPFAGELLRVDEAEGEWEGAIERLLHNFGLSLLVPEGLYAQVSHYVDRTHLHGRLVYFRVREAAARPARLMDPTALPRKLRIKPDSAFYPWLEQELAERFDYVCCTDLDQFRRLPKAITRNGQFKTGGQRHEKDDRRSIHDRSQYVLGWSNEGKIQALESKQRLLERRMQEAAGALAALETKRRGFNDRRDAARDLLNIKDFAELDWKPLACEIQQLEEEKRQIEQGSDVLLTLRRQLEETQRAGAEAEDRERELNRETARQEERRETAARELAEAAKLDALLAGEERAQWLALLDSHRAEAQPGLALNLQNLEKSQRELREHLQHQIDNDELKHKRLAERIIKQMQQYKTDYPAETTEVDPSLQALADFGAMLAALTNEDLPRHEQRFKQLLNEGTINSVALFQNQLDKEREEIKAKIQAINTSLGDIEYNPGTYITLLMDSTQDVEVREFQADLRQCLAHSLDDSELYNETKFLQVKAIIERFNGREGMVDLDRRWTRKVTDVRNWFGFSASERWREDDTEREYYSDSAGKSGGQKEKLAYTILASALAFQFGLEWNAVKSRSFRFVVIDEAFGKGSDESTRYGLELFKKLKLQLLIVTPLQKIHIIEDYIASVHYVHNEEGRNSVLRNLTVEEYRAEKQAYRQAAGVLQ